jgi:hypothetical protein
MHNCIILPVDIHTNVRHGRLPELFEMIVMGIETADYFPCFEASSARHIVMWDGPYHSMSTV